jgi:hypothetical protein
MKEMRKEKRRRRKAEKEERKEERIGHEAKRRIPLGEESRKKRR